MASCGNKITNKLLRIRTQFVLSVELEACGAVLPGERRVTEATA